MPLDEITFEVEEKMEEAAAFLEMEYRGLRTGRASVALVDHIKVEYYGSQTDLRQLATISTPQATMILIKPFDPGGLKDIERAILASDLGITPNNDGKMIRLVVPPLSGERRERIASHLKKLAESARVVVRGARRNGNKCVEKEEKASLLSEDEAKKAKEQIQKITGRYEQKITELLDAKTRETEES